MRATKPLSLPAVPALGERPVRDDSTPGRAAGSGPSGPAGAPSPAPPAAGAAPATR
jgi:hypothetical protein